MERLVCARQMKELDQRTIREIGIPSLVLMERAALAVVWEIKKRKFDLRSVLVVCGSGNNGGDGFAIARLLAEDECQVTLAFVGKETSMTKETALQRQICEKCGIKISSNFMEDEYTTIVDAVFGIGLSRAVSGYPARVIEWINRQSCKTVSVDIPSGVCADDGKVAGEAVRADLTVTFACRKIGQILYPGAGYCGTVVCRNIGILPGGGSSVFTYGDEDLAAIPKRKAYSNKGTYGKVALFAGSMGMGGAAYLAAKAACRSGCGMVRVITPECNRPVLQASLPEAMVTIWDPKHPDVETVKKVIAWSDAVGIGPGIGTGKEAGLLLSLVLENCRLPLVVDADGLNLLAEAPELLHRARAEMILTPHIGEMMRLSEKKKEAITENLPGCASGYAKEHGVICVLKDTRTVVSDGERVYINTSGNNGMAAAGSGDVLTGLLCGLLAQGMQPFDAAALGVFVHGRAGDLAREELGAYGMMAGDLADRIGAVLKTADHARL